MSPGPNKKLRPANNAEMPAAIPRSQTKTRLNRPLDALFWEKGTCSSLRSGSSARGGDHARSSKCRALGEYHQLPTHAKARAFLENFAKRRIPITYQALAKALQILRPHSIHRVTEALERLMEEDAAADRPFIAALAIRGAWRPTRARVLRLRPTSRPVRGRSGRSGRMVVSRCRAKRRLRSLGRSARQLTATI